MVEESFLRGCGKLVARPRKDFWLGRGKTLMRLRKDLTWPREDFDVAEERLLSVAEGRL